MLDYRDIITKHFALGMSGGQISELLGVSKSGVNDFLRAFKDCKTLSYPLPPGITNYGIAAEVYGKNPNIVGRDLSYELPDYEAVVKSMTSRQNMTLVVLWNRYSKRCRDSLRNAHLRGCPQELSDCVDSADREYLPRGITETLSFLDFVASGMNLCILGPSDSGKSYLAKALGIVACNDYKVEYYHCEVLLEQLVALKSVDYMRYQKRLKKICGASLLILDNFLLHTLSDEREVKILFEILEKRCEINLSTIICSQRDPSSWSAMIMNDEVSTNAILKRATKHYTVMIKPKAAG